MQKDFQVTSLVALADGTTREITLPVHAWTEDEAVAIDAGLDDVLEVLEVDGRPVALSERVLRSAARRLGVESNVSWHPAIRFDGDPDRVLRLTLGRLVRDAAEQAGKTLDEIRKAHIAAIVANTPARRTEEPQAAPVTLRPWAMERPLVSEFLLTEAANAERADYQYIGDDIRALVDVDLPRAGSMGELLATFCAAAKLRTEHGPAIEAEALARLVVALSDGKHLCRN